MSSSRLRHADGYTVAFGAPNVGPVALGEAGPQLLVRAAQVEPDRRAWLKRALGGAEAGLAQRAAQVGRTWVVLEHIKLAAHERRPL